MKSIQKWTVGGLLTTGLCAVGFVPVLVCRLLYARGRLTRLAVASMPLPCFASQLRMPPEGLGAGASARVAGGGTIVASGRPRQLRRSSA